MDNRRYFGLDALRGGMTMLGIVLRGFTALAERLPPEQVVQMLNAYFEVMIDLVLAYNGTINEIIGDVSRRTWPRRAWRGRTPPGCHRRVSPPL